MRKSTKYFTLGALVLATFVLGAGFWLEQTVEKALMKGLEQDLLTIRDSNITALQEWMQAQERIASLSAAEPEAREVALALIAASQNDDLDKEALFHHPLQTRLREAVGPTIQHWEFLEFVLVADDVVIASADENAIGRRLRGETRERLERLEADGSRLGRPRIREEWNGEKRAAMWVASPIRDDLGRMKGAFAFRIDPRASFTRILRSSQYGESGETYAFDKEGLMLSESRFDEQLRRAGVLEEGQGSLLTLSVREPGLDLTQQGAQALKKAGPLTKAVLGVLSGEQDFDTHGYLDYRGVEVVGAWKWLPDYEFGITTEINKAEAYRSLSAVRNGTRALFLVLLLTALLVVVASAVISRLQRKAAKTERLGQYTLEKKLGEGGMGAVYRARHALLRRATAIKVIRPENIDARTRERFEREVQATAQLCHPNTIAVYDYGRTNSGVFYYAMEFLGGVDLHNLVRKDGPLPEARVLHILAQVLGSLAEAHDHGMVHRDIKPPNIMLCRRGGVADVVKVLDFGLVKDVQSDDGFTMENALTGTPHYMAPESVTAASEVDQRTDLYAVSAVGYFLLTGRQLFDGPTVMSILTKQIADPPPRPSASAPVSAGLEALLLRGLSKEPSDRPASAHIFLKDLQELIVGTEAWTQDQANTWWDEHESAFVVRPKSVGSGEPTLEIDLSGRDLTSSNA